MAIEIKIEIEEMDVILEIDHIIDLEMDEIIEIMDVMEIICLLNS